MTKTETPPSSSTSHRETRKSEYQQTHWFTTISTTIKQIIPRFLIGKDTIAASITRATTQFFADHAVDPTPEQQAHTNEFVLQAMRFSLLKVPDVMTPRADIVGLEESMTFQDAVLRIAEQPYSRYPVYERSIDNIVGFVHVKDILVRLAHNNPPENLKSMCRPAIITAESSLLDELLLNMRQKSTHLAIVVDEYGGVDGLVTVEDLVESVVGDITDEFDRKSLPLLFSRNKDGVIVSARMTIKEFTTHFGLTLSEEEQEQDINTIGGLMIYLLDDVPKANQRITHEASGIELEALKVTPRRLISILIRINDSAPTSQSDAEETPQ